MARISIDKQENIYRLKKAKITLYNGFVDRWIITYNNIPIFQVNEWLIWKARNRASTGKAYGNAILRYLKYLHKIGINYKDVTLLHIRGYVNHLFFNSENRLTNIEPQISYGTVKNYLSAVSEFYKWMADELCINIPLLGFEEDKQKQSFRLNKSFLYGQIWTKGIDDFSLGRKFKLKTQKKIDYIKWYTSEEIDAIAENFKTLRDRIIFLISVEVGYRIEEILTMQYEDFDGFNSIVRCSMSKTKKRKNVIPKYLCDEVNRYIYTERQEIENKVGILEYLFINLKKGVDQGMRLSYRNYWEILKRAAKRAGLEPKKIRSHSGRSTKVQHLIEQQILHPEKNITDMFIKEYFGWVNIDSLMPYKKREQTTEVLNTIAKKVSLRSRVQEDELSE